MYRFILIIALFAMVVLCPICIAADFSEDFEGGELGDWVVVDDPDELMSDKSPSSWAIMNGPLRGKAAYQGSNRWGDPTDQIALGTYLIYDKAEWADFSFEFDTVANDNDGLGFVWRWKDRLNHYRFMKVIDTGSRGPFRRIEKRLGADGDKFPYYDFLAKSSDSYEQGIPIHFKVVMEGTKMTVSMDDKDVLNATDNTYAKGKIGFALYAEQAYFDNVELKELNTAVDPRSKVAAKWGGIKSEYSY